MDEIIRKVEILTWTYMSTGTWGCTVIMDNNVISSDDFTICTYIIMTGFKRSPIIQMRPFCTLYNFISWSSVIVIFFHVYPSRKFAYWSNMFLRSSQFHFAFIINLLPFHLFPNKILQYCLYVNSDFTSFHCYTRKHHYEYFPILFDHYPEDIFMAFFSTCHWRNVNIL